jgi:hypothetical protein
MQKTRMCLVLRIEIKPRVSMLSNVEILARGGKLLYKGWEAYGARKRHSI